MSVINGFLDNLLNKALSPRGDMADYRHSAYLYNQNAFALAPKHKFLYHVVFEPSSAALQFMPQLSNRSREEINMLVKTVELPQFNAVTETKNQYNRKKNIQTSISYSPIRIEFHDDNVGITTALLESYYRYYYRDGNLISNPSAYDPRGTYKSSQLAGIKYGLNNGTQVPFFNRITVFQLARHVYTGFTLINPLVNSWSHDALDYSDSQTTTNTLEISYEAVHYTRGNVGEDSPAGFAKSHYDSLPSSISTGSSLGFGNGGVLGSVGSLLNDASSGTAGLDTILQTVNLYQNAKELNTSQLATTGLNILENITSSSARAAPLFIKSTTGSNSLSGIPNTVFPKGAGVGALASQTTSIGGKTDSTSSLYQAKINQARENNQ